MTNLGGFNADDHKSLDSRDLIPTGNYRACIVASEMKETKSGNGEFLSLEFSILSGDHQNRKLWSNLNLDNPNPKAVEIAHRELATICKALGITTPGDSEKLHNLPLMIHVRTVVRKDNGEKTNEIRGYSADEKLAQVESGGRARDGDDLF